MSIDPGTPMDFVDWVGAQDNPHAFLSRAKYNDYVMAKLSEAIRSSPGKLRLIRSDVVSATERSVQLSDGQVIEAEAVILATGLAPRITPQHLATDARVIDAW